MRRKNKLYKTIKRRLKKRGKYFAYILSQPKHILGTLVIGGAASLILVNMHDTHNIYTTHLLNTIAKVESKYNYNAYFGNPNNTSIKFTSMSVSEVVAWQKRFVEAGNPSSAVGRYQFMDTTLQGLVRELKIDKNAKFDETLQDRLAARLLERRGVREYVDKKITS